MKNLLLFLLLFTVIFNSFSQNEMRIFRPSDSDEIQKVGKFAYYLEDKTGKLSIEDIQKEEYQRQFRANNENILNFGMNENYYWIRIEASAYLNDRNDNFLLQTMHVLENVSFFKKDSTGNWREYAGGAGNYAKQTNKLILTPYLTLKNHQNREIYYIKIQNQGYAIALQTVKKSTFEQNTFFKHLVLFLLTGLLLAILIRNIFTFFTEFAATDFIYILLCLTYILNIAYYEGYFHFILYYFDFSNTSFSYLNCGIFISNTMTALLAAFMIAFFRLKVKSVFFIGFVFLIILALLNYAVFFIDDFLQPLFTIQIIAVLLYPLTFLLCIVKIYQKEDGAWLIFLAYLLFYAFSTLDIIAGNSDIVAYSATVSYSVIGIFCEVFIFAYANLQKNRNYQLALIRGKEEAQEQAVKQLIENQRIVSEQNVMLEARVRERTEELLSANEELMQSQEEITMQRDSLTWKNLELEKKQSLIDDSINAALIIQNAILPSKVKMELAFSNYYLLFKPKNTVSGDFYWLGELDNITIIAVADCTGHGVQGALMSMIGNTLLDKIVLLQQITDPAEILNRLHSEINNRLRQHESNSREGMDIAVFAWETDGFNVDVSFEGAKRPLYYVLKGENQVHEVKSARKGVGGSQNEEKFFETKKLHLPLKSFFLLQSDGLIDQQDSKNEKIGSKGMKEFFAENAPKGFAEFGRNLDKKLENQLRDSVQRDDILVLAFEI